MLERKVFRKPGGWYGVIISSPDPHYRIPLLLGGGCWCWLPPLTAAAEERTGDCCSQLHVTILVGVLRDFKM